MCGNVGSDPLSCVKTDSKYELRMFALSISRMNSWPLCLSGAIPDELLSFSFTNL